MKFLRSYYITTSILLFTLFTVTAHVFAPIDYSFSKDAISALGAQGYDKKLLMQLGFFSFGLILSTGIIIDRPGWRELPILIYSLSIGMTGIFCTKPLHEQTGFTYSETQANIHFIFSQIAAFLFWLGVLIQMISSTGSKPKINHFIFLVVLATIGLSMRFMLFKNDLGLAQRVLFLISFVWLIKYYKPKKNGA